MKTKKTPSKSVRPEIPPIDFGIDAEAAALIKSISSHECVTLANLRACPEMASEDLLNALPARWRETLAPIFEAFDSFESDDDRLTKNQAIQGIIHDLVANYDSNDWVLVTHARYLRHALKLIVAIR
jgi:hypothetical protein